MVTIAVKTTVLHITRMKVPLYGIRSMRRRSSEQRRLHGYYEESGEGGSGHGIGLGESRGSGETAWSGTSGMRQRRPGEQMFRSLLLEGMLTESWLMLKSYRQESNESAAVCDSAFSAERRDPVAPKHYNADSK